MRYGIISDVHAPMHGDQYNLAIDCLADSVDCLIINGDFLDFYSVSAYGKHPDVQFAIEEEINWGRDELNRLNKKFKKVVFLLGNHENRLERYILSNCPAFWNLCDLERMLNLKEIGIEWHDYQVEYKITESLRLQHSPPSYSQNLARTSLLKKPGASYIYGCSHRLDFAVINLSNGGTCEVYSTGWLGSTDKSKEHRRVFAYMKGHQGWQHGFAIVDLDQRGRHHVELCHIKGDTVKADGNLWQI